MYYLKTIEHIRETILKFNPGCQAEFVILVAGDIAKPEYLLWMVDEIQKMDITQIELALKAARWIGWVMAHMEVLGYWNNLISRDMVRLDKTLGYDNIH